LGPLERTPPPLKKKYTYLLTPWCRVLLEKLTGLQVVKKLPAFHGTRRFITALASVRQLSLSWASPNHSVKLFSDWPSATNKRAWRYAFDAEIGVKAISCHALVNERAASLDHNIEC